MGRRRRRRKREKPGCRERPHRRPVRPSLKNALT